MDVFWTVLSGVVVFVAGQIIVRFFIDPIVAFREELGRMQHCLIERQIEIHQLDNSGGLAKEIATRTGELIARKKAVPFYSMFAKFPSLPSDDDIESAHIELHRLYRDLIDPEPSEDVLAGLNYLLRLCGVFDVSEAKMLDSREAFGPRRKESFK